MTTMKRTNEILVHKTMIKNSNPYMALLNIKNNNSMKKLSVKLLTLILALGIFSCSDLKEEPYSTVTTASFFKTSEDAEIAINGIYHGVHTIGFYRQQGVFTIIMPGMFTVSRSATVRNRMTYNFDASDAKINQTWRSHFDIINR